MLAVLRTVSCHLIAYSGCLAFDRIDTGTQLVVSFRKLSPKQGEIFSILLDPHLELLKLSLEALNEINEFLFTTVDFLLQGTQTICQIG